METQLASSSNRSEIGKLSSDRAAIITQNLPSALAAALSSALPKGVEVLDAVDLSDDITPKALIRCVSESDLIPPGKCAIHPCIIILPQPDPAAAAAWIKWGATAVYDLQTYPSSDLSAPLAAHARQAATSSLDPNAPSFSATVEWDCNLRITRWPDSAIQLFGYAESDALNRVIDDWLFPAEDIRLMLSTSAAVGDPSFSKLRFSCRVRSYDGSLLRTQWNVYPTADATEPATTFRGDCRAVALAGEFFPSSGFHEVQNDNEIAPDHKRGLWDHHLSDQTLFWSPSVFSRLGYRYREIEPSPAVFLERVHRDDRPRLKQAYLDCLRGRSDAFSAIYRIQDHSGNWRYYQANARCIGALNEPQKRRIIGSDFDITRYVDTVEELKFAKMTVDNSSTGVLWINTRGRIIYCNKSAESLLQYSASDLAALHIQDIDPELAPPPDDPVEAWNTKLAIRESTYPRNSGKPIDVEVDTRYIDNSGEIILAVYLRDISRRKTIERQIANLNKDLEKRVEERTEELAATNKKLVREMKERASAEEAVSQQRAFLAYVLEKLPVGVYVKDGDRDYRIGVWNAEMERLFQTRKAQILGKDIKDVFADPILVNLLGDMRKQDVHSRAIMPRLKGHDGEATPFVADITRAPIYDRRGKLIALVGIVQDVTDRINSENRLIAAFNELEVSKAKLEASNLEIRKGIEKAKKLAVAAQASNQAKSYFMSNISHELRTPLNSIVSLTHVLLERAYGELNSKQSEYLTLIEENGKHLQSLITDILDLSKIELGKLSLHFDHVALNEIAEASTKIIAQQAADNDIQCRLESDDAIEIEADPKRLRQIIINLLGNAVKFSSHRSSVSISTQKLNSNVALLQVSDQGIGIEKDHLSKIFEPFSQIDSRLARNFEGTGLGLAIVNKFVELHGGSVSARSIAGKGSTFSVRLPLSQSGLPTDFSKLPESGDQRPHAPHAIVIDDGVYSARHTLKALASQGFKTVYRLQPGELLHRIESLSPEIAIVDIASMRSIGGDILKTAQSRSNWKNTRWVAVTSLDLPEERAWADSYKIDHYMPKPFFLDKSVT